MKTKWTCTVQLFIERDGYSIAWPVLLVRRMKYFKLAAKQGHADAQCSLGSMYEMGQGVKPSYERAFIWYNLAAEQDYAKAQYNLGCIFT